MHLVATTQDFPDIPAGSEEVDHVERVTERMIADVRVLTAWFGPDKVITENVIWRGTEGRFLYACVAPSVISDVVRNTGCGLLIDTAHASMTCQYTEMPVIDYIAALPTERLRELHVTGIGQKEGRWRDSMPLREQDFQTVSDVLGDIGAGRAILRVAF